LWNNDDDDDDDVHVSGVRLLLWTASHYNPCQERKFRFKRKAAKYHTMLVDIKYAFES
jgi:hypothetical protein